MRLRSLGGGPTGGIRMGSGVRPLGLPLGLVLGVLGLRVTVLAGLGVLPYVLLESFGFVIGV